jgi:hypothetical protein
MLIMTVSLLTSAVATARRTLLVAHPFSNPADMQYYR